jgi:hypothetical protein
MPDVPESAVHAAMRAIRALPYPHWEITEERVARATLEAAAPLLAEATLGPILKRHAPIRDDQWGAYYCGTCWDKHGRRPVSPCGELLAIAAILPAAAGNESAHSAPTGEDGES